jgi:hypothetical protein
VSTEAKASRLKKPKIVYFVILFWTYILTISVLWSSRNLRPAADDYSFGQTAERGPIAAIGIWWNVWSGDVSSIFANVFLVGWPLQVLPWSLGSSIAFFASGLMVSISLVLIVRSSIFGRDRYSLWSIVPTIPFFLVNWWSFWWLNRILNPDNKLFEAQTSAITFWQNVNTSYVFLYSLILLLLFKLDLISKKQNYPKWNFLIFLFSGLLVGFSGAVIVASVLVFILLLPISSWLDGKRLPKVKVFSWGLFTIAMVTAALISSNSPGSQRRQSYLSELSIDEDTVPLMVKTMIPSLVDWWKALFNQGMLLSVVLALLIAIILVWHGYEFHTKELQRIAFHAIAFSVILSIIVGYSQVFAYPAWWHRIGVQVVLWLGMVLFSFSSCQQIIKLRPKLSQLSFVLVILMMINTMAVIRMQGEISERYSKWQVGPAPISLITDIEHINGWQRACYQKIKDERGGPDRGLKKNPPKGSCD